MTAWPTDPDRTFLRDPDLKWKHDGFGHDQQHDVGIRDLCFRVGGHSGLDLTGRGPIFSVLGGVVAWSGWTDRAGWAVIEDVTTARWGRIFPIYFHGAARMRAVGPVREGDQLGSIGDTGSGTAPGQFHLHFSVATSLDAALNLIRNGLYPRGKRTVAQWAAANGLIDPLPILRDAQHPKTDAPAALPDVAAPANPAIPAPIDLNGDLMYRINAQKKTWLLARMGNGAWARHHLSGSEDTTFAALGVPACTLTDAQLADLDRTLHAFSTNKPRR